MKLQEEIDQLEIPGNIDQLPPMQQLALFWGVIAAILTFVKFFTGAKADEKIDKILEFGNNHVLPLKRGL